MTEITEEAKFEITDECFMQAKGEALLDSFASSSKMLSFLSAVILVVNAIFVYLIFYITNTSAVLMFLVGGSVINLFSYLNISSCLQNYNGTLGEVIFLESKVAPFRIFHCEQKLKEVFGETDFRGHAKNMAFVMIILYAIGAVLFADYNDLSVLSVLYLV